MPSGTTNVETRAVYDAARSAGARVVFLVEEPMAAAIGIRLPIKEPIGSMIIDIGGGTTDIAVISLGGIVKSKNLKIAGDRLNNDIISYMRDEFKILIGERTAEMVKIAIGSVLQGEYMETEVHGRDLDRLAAGSGGDRFGHSRSDGEFDQGPCGRCKRYVGNRSAGNFVRHSASRDYSFRRRSF